ncbi:MFS transporter [Paracoccus nototheniae]|uniref:MFS transporter n=1 Tax=Paracoccus nototheniae TaxID=2489002 RepID=A0ABW4DX04_9RHOB|nr:MFS transporter [Paracoccus nototheniae]
MAASVQPGSAGSRLNTREDADDHHVSPSDIAVGVIIGRTSEFFDFFVFSIACVLVFPARLFGFLGPVEGTLASFVLLALAFVARPVGTVIFMAVDRAVGRKAKLTASLLLLGTSTVAMGLVPSYDTLGWWAILIMAALRIGQGLALGGAWDGLPSLLALSVPREKRGFYAMIPQLGAPIGLFVAAVLYVYLLINVSAEEFIDWGWRYPFFVAFAINVVALFARLRIVASPDFDTMLTSSELNPTRIRPTLRQDGRGMVLGIFVPLASFAMFHMVTIFPLSWVFLYSNDAPELVLYSLMLGSVAGIGSIVASGYIADGIGRQRLLMLGALAIGAFALFGPLLLAAGREGATIYIVLGFILLGLSFGQSSGVIASLFGKRNRYTASALVSSLSWMFGAGFAPLTALSVASYLGLWAAGIYLLSGAICTIVAIRMARRSEMEITDE